MDGKIKIDPLITHRLALADINHGFDLMPEGKSIRSVVVYSAGPLRSSRAGRGKVAASILLPSRSRMKAAK